MLWTRALTLICLISLTMACTANRTSESGINSAAANSNAKPASQSPAGIDPCTLLTEEDAAGALEASVKKVTPQGLSTADTCQYLREKGENLAQKGESVTLQVHFGGGKLFDSYVKETEQSFDTRAQPIEGVGDKAVFNAGQFMVLKKNDFFVVTIGKNMPDAEKLAASRALARKVFARL